MAQQNARLVSAYVQKKQELRTVQDMARTSALQWEVSSLPCTLTMLTSNQHLQSCLATCS